jgi:hypothetical protein
MKMMRSVRMGSFASPLRGSIRRHRISGQAISYIVSVTSDIVLSCFVLNRLHATLGSCQFKLEGAMVQQLHSGSIPDDLFLPNVVIYFLTLKLSSSCWPER